MRDKKGQPASSTDLRQRACRRDPIVTRSMTKDHPPATRKLLGHTDSIRRSPIIGEEPNRRQVWRQDRLGPPRRRPDLALARGLVFVTHP